MSKATATDVVVVVVAVVVNVIVVVPFPGEPCSLRMRGGGGEADDGRDPVLFVARPIAKETRGETKNEAIEKKKTRKKTE